jgi:hypothetical protein
VEHCKNVHFVKGVTLQRKLYRPQDDQLENRVRNTIIFKMSNPNDPRVVWLTSTDRAEDCNSRTCPNFTCKRLPSQKVFVWRNLFAFKRKFHLSFHHTVQLVDTLLNRNVINEYIQRLSVSLSIRVPDMLAPWNILLFEKPVIPQRVNKLTASMEHKNPQLNIILSDRIQ